MSLFGNFLNALGIRRVGLGREAVTGTRPLAHREFLVPNMVCEGCAEKISGALTAMPGVRDVTAKVAQKRIRVRYEPSTIDAGRLRDALVGLGFSAHDA